VAYNYPIDLFDKGDDVSYATLGLRLDTPKEIAVTLSNFQNPAPRGLRLANTLIDGGETKEPAFNLVPYVSNLLGYLMDQVNANKLRRVDDKRTIYISSGSVGSTDFGLSQDKKEGLCNNGENAVKSFFTWWDIDQKTDFKAKLPLPSIELVSLDDSPFPTNKSCTVLKGIEGDHKLKHADTTDKSGPPISADVHVKKVDRDGFLKDVAADHSLKHADTVDKSAPQIAEDVHVKKVDRNPFLNEVGKGVDLKSGKIMFIWPSSANKLNAMTRWLMR